MIFKVLQELKRKLLEAEKARDAALAELSQARAELDALRRATVVHEPIAMDAPCFSCNQAPKHALDCAYRPYPAAVAAQRAQQEEREELEAKVDQARAKASEERRAWAKSEREKLRMLDLSDDEIIAVRDRVLSAYQEHDPGDPESHAFWTTLLQKTEKALRLVDARRGAEPLCVCGQSKQNHEDRIGAARDCTYMPSVDARRGGGR